MLSKPFRTVRVTRPLGSLRRSLRCSSEVFAKARFRSTSQFAISVATGRASAHGRAGGGFRKPRRHLLPSERTRLFHFGSTDAATSIVGAITIQADELAGQLDDLHGLAAATVWSELAARQLSDGWQAVGASLWAWPGRLVYAVDANDVYEPTVTRSLPTQIPSQPLCEQR